MITKNFFSDSMTPSINELSPIYNHKYSAHTYNDPGKYSNQKNHYSLEKHKQSNEKRNPSTEKRRYSNEKYPNRLDSQNQLNEKYGILSRNHTDEKNSLLLRSYDKYDHASNVSRQDKIIEEKKSDSQSSPVFQTELSSVSKPYHFDHRSPQFTQLKPSPISPLPSEYELLLEYELKREKQKNQILQKRLNNKEEFIDQMKKIQQDLTIAYGKCQQDLNNANIIIYEMQTKGIKEIRDYKEEIQELKHQILTLQKQLIQKQSRKPKPSSSKKSLAHFQSNDSPKEQIDDGKRYVKSKSSVHLTKHQSISEANLNNPPIPRKTSHPASYFYDYNEVKQPLVIDEKKTTSKDKQTDKNRSQNGINANKRQSSSLANPIVEINKKFANAPLNSQFSSVSQPPKQETNLLNTFKPLQVISSQLPQFETQILSNLSKVANFLQHFIDMCGRMQETNESRQKQSKQNQKNQKDKLIHSLKKYWKWIKDVIKEWKEMKDERTIQKKGTKKFGGISNLSIKLQQEEHAYDTEHKPRHSKFNPVDHNPSSQKHFEVKGTDNAVAKKEENLVQQRLNE